MGTSELSCVMSKRKGKIGKKKKMFSFCQWTFLKVNQEIQRNFEEWERQVMP